MRIDTLIILDTETTGLDPAKDRCIEIAFAAYDLDAHTPIGMSSLLIHADENAAEAINRIPVAALRRMSPSADPWENLRATVAGVAQPAAFVAHRADFDRSFTPSAIAAMLPWVCSKFDVEWPLSKPGASLVDVALAHGVPVHDNHRALTDVMLLVKTFQRVHELGHDVQAMLARAVRPKVEVVSLAPFGEKDVVKASGFAWDPTRKVWHRRMAQEDVAALPFQVRRG